MGTYGIHDIKFYTPDPKAITCIACEPKTAKLAVARSDQSIEIWDVSETPNVDRVILGDNLSNSVQCLVWSNERLFSGNLQGFVNEYDLRRLKIKSSTAVTSGTCWCLAVHKKKQLLAAGTEEGHINLFQISDEGLLYEKLLDKQEGRILCAAWHPSGDFLVTGSLNAVRVWNIHQGHALHKMSLDKVKYKSTKVWCIAVCADFTVITGDSSGYMKFWDGQAGIQNYEIKTHKRDILTLCMSEDENNLYCAGVDPTVVCFQRARKPVKSKSTSAALGTGSEKDGHWIRCVNRMIHDSGDVKGLALYGNKLYSGGVDSYLALSYYPPKTLIKYPCCTVSQSPPVTLSKSSRIILLQYTNHIELWTLGETDQVITEDMPLESDIHVNVYPRIILKMKSIKNEPIRCSSISNNGKYLVYSTENELRMNSLGIENLTNPISIETHAKIEASQITRIKDLPEEINGPCLHLRFSHSSNLMAAVLMSGPICVLEVESLTVKYTVDPYKTNLMSDIISLVQITDCAKEYLVICDRASHIVVYSQGKHYVSLPRYKKSPTALAIHPSANTLVVVYADHKIVEFDLIKKSFTSFSRKLDSNHPKEWLERNLPILNISFDPRDSNVIYLIDDTTICAINKNKSLANTDAKIPRLGPKIGDGSNSAHVSESKVAFHFVRRNKHLAFFDWLNNKEMVSVQVNPLSIMEKLPPTWNKKQYGVC